MAEELTMINQVPITIYYDENGNPYVLGRELHQYLEVDTEYRHWFPRMCEYGFEEGKDFNPLKNDRVRIEGSREVLREVSDHKVSIPMAKELSMIQRTPKGKIARQWFLDLEEAWNTPEMVMARAIKMADKQISTLKAQNAQMQERLQISAPKVAYFDELVDRKLNTGVRDTAKELGVRESDFTDFLIDEGYVYRNQQNRLRPYAPYTESGSGLFVLKDCIARTNNKWSGAQMFVTPKGKETFRLLLKKEASV